MAAGLQARVLIVARDDGLAGPLAEGLDRLGWRTITARGRYAAIAALTDLQIEAAIIDLKGTGEEALHLARRLKAACAPRKLPVIADAAGPASIRRAASRSFSCISRRRGKRFSCACPPSESNHSVLMPERM